MMQTLAHSDYEIIRKLVYEHSRIDLGSGKKELVTARLGKRLRATGLTTLEEYVSWVSGNTGTEELVHLIDAISTNHTFFFREIKHFEFLARQVLPELISGEAPNSTREFRLWSAACSSGEEPYSLSILLQDYFKSSPGWNWSIQASDISTKILDRARQGVYPEDRIREVRPEWLHQYFQKGVNQWDGYFRVKEALRKKIGWHHLNLLQHSYPFTQPFHCIWCRNVMIYFDRATQEQLVEQLSRQLLPGGHLMIGHSESLTGISHNLVVVRPAIYRKKLEGKG